MTADVDGGELSLQIVPFAWLVWGDSRSSAGLRDEDQARGQRSRGRWVAGPTRPAKEASQRLKLGPLTSGAWFAHSQVPPMSSGGNLGFPPSECPFDRRPGNRCPPRPRTRHPVSNARPDAADHQGHPRPSFEGEVAISHDASDVTAQPVAQVGVEVLHRPRGPARGGPTQRAPPSNSRR
jgi:hypothetical protein